MKKISTIVLLAVTCLQGFCQQKTSGNNSAPDTLYPAIRIVKEPRFILNLHSGYAAGMGSTFKFYPDDVSSIVVTQDGNNAPSKSVTYSNPTKGLGDGFKFGFGLSYILNDFINVGLDFDYFRSTIKKYRDSSYHITNTVIASNSNADEYSYTEHNTLSYKATLLSFTPNITFKAISRPKWFLYNKVGATLTFRPNSLQNDVTDSKSSMGWQGFYKDTIKRVEKKYEWQIKNPAFGFLGAVGVQVKAADRLRVYAEAQFSHTVFVIHKRTLTDFIIDNEHIEKTLPTSARELDFVKTYSNNAESNDTNKPSQTIVQRIPIDYLGLQIGIAYQLK